MEIDWIESSMHTTGVGVVPTARAMHASAAVGDDLVIHGGWCAAKGDQSMLADLYVLLSRVREGKRLYVVGFDPTIAVHVQWLLKLRHPPEMWLWADGPDARSYVISLRCGDEVAEGKPQP